MEELKVNITEPKATRRDLDITIPRERFENLFDEKVKKYSKELKLNGFRKGSVPKRLISERFREPITNEALEALVSATIKEVCDQNKIVPISQAQVENLRNENGQPIVLKAWVEIDQPVDIVEYKNLGIEMPPIVPASDDDVEHSITHHLEEQAHEHTVNGPAQLGHIAIGEYIRILIGGQEHPLGENRKFRVEVGKDRLEEFNKAFLGSEANQIIIVDVEYPSDYSLELLAGKKCNYEIRVDSIVEKHLPTLDDAYAEKMGMTSLEEWKKNVRVSIEDQRTQQARQVAMNQAIHKILERHPFEVAESQIQRLVEHTKEQQQGDKNAKLAPDAEKQLREYAEFEIKKMRIVQQVAQKENIKAAQDEVDARITDMAARYGIPFESLKQHLRESGRIADIRMDIQTGKVLELLAGI